MKRKLERGNYQILTSCMNPDVKGMIINLTQVNKTVTGNIGEGCNNLVIFGLKVKLDMTPEFSIVPKKVSVLVGKYEYLRNHACLSCL